MSYQHQHVWNSDNIRLVPNRHGGLKVVLSVFHVGHCVVEMECDVVLLTVLSGRKKKCTLKPWASRSTSVHTGKLPNLKIQI